MRALISNLFITTPSINDPALRLHFTLRTIYLSLLANSRPQTEALLHYSLQTLNDLDVSPAQCLSLYSQFLALLVFIPDTSKDQPLLMFKEFVKVVQRKKWPQNSEGMLGDAWILCLRYLWAVSRREFPVKFTNVQSNDVFHGSSSIYTTAIMENLDMIMQQLLALIETQSPAKPTVALHLLEFAVVRLELRGPVVKLVSNLLKRCAKSGQFVVRVRCIIDDLIKLSETNEEVKQALVKLNDDDDFDSLSTVDSSPGKNVAKRNGSDEEKFYELMRKYEELKKKMDDVDELARQIKFAMELQKLMSDCYSNRVTSFPIETGMEMRCLASGSLLILFTIHNKTSDDLIGWSISASLSPTMADTASTSSSLSQSIALQTLAP
ncbi:unnamed protein product, partial [Cylicostephanus goldi]